MSKILVADDDEVIRMLYEDELTEEGYDVITYSDGLRFMEMIEHERPDLIVMDIRLGGHNGLDLLLEIRKAYDNLPVILCTAYPASMPYPKSIAADYYILNSSNLNVLKNTIRIALGGGKQKELNRKKNGVHQAESNPLTQLRLFEKEML
jgi:DNA-binding response OmpR family regulator